MKNNSENKYICEYCEKLFKAKFALTRHINIIHLKKTLISQKRNKKQCSNCGKNISISNYSKHYKSCINGNHKNDNNDVKEILSKCIINDNKYICPICNKEYSKMGIGIHIWHKHTESGKNFIMHTADGYKNGTRVVWNKGLTKENDSRILKSIITFKNNHKLGKHKKVIIKDKELWKKNISNAALKSKHRRVCKKSVPYTCKDGTVVILDSSYEIKLAKILDEQNIRWTRPTPIRYKDRYGKLHHYFADFYLPDYNIYLDPKNDYCFNEQKDKIIILLNTYSNVYFLRYNQLEKDFILNLINDI